MKRLVGQGLLIVALGVASGALHSLATEDDPLPAKGVQVIELTAAKRLFDRKAAVFVDARPAWPYQLGHVPGAIHVPPSASPAALAVLADVPKDTALVVYCSGTTCDLGGKLAHKIAAAMDFTRLYVFAGGFPQWEAAGYAVASEGPF